MVCSAGNKLVDMIITGVNVILPLLTDEVLKVWGRVTPDSACSYSPFSFPFAPLSLLLLPSPPPFSALPLSLLPPFAPLPSSTLPLLPFFPSSLSSILLPPFSLFLSPSSPRCASNVLNFSISYLNISSDEYLTWRWLISFVPWHHYWRQDSPGELIWPVLSSFRTCVHPNEDSRMAVEMLHVERLSNKNFGTLHWMLAVIKQWPCWTTL